ncbi:hypothetical protein DQQ10_14915 [Pseudochryseolinea flava]|uniref:Uncharacterized protein n=2 Tax=Pseudochryseolinea flava TaxID=2059302 RepID=A0A364Y0L1_9BACT|nr:hypothetical protein DQQ10_14915 [Pseudochryseolinea flava]
MSSCADEDSLMNIGKAYRAQYNNEQSEESLIDALTQNNMHLLHESDGTKITHYLEQRIQNDFEKNEIVIVDGWILSRTEARQCALFSIIS